MSSATTRQAKRAPVTLKIKFKSSTLEQFVDRYAVDISQGGIFIRTKSPLEVGTPLRFEFQLKDATPLITGEGTVVWTREHDPGRTGLAPGMGVRFDRLPSDSQRVLNKILDAKKATPEPEPEPEEEFRDSPTRVAPRDVIAGLAEGSRERPSPVKFGGDEHTPLDAFDEQTKVGLLDELVARTADSSADDEEPIFTSAPRLPEPPPLAADEPIGHALDDMDDQATVPIDDPPTQKKLPALPDLGAMGGAAHIAITPPPSFPEAEEEEEATAVSGRTGPASIDFRNVQTELNMAPPPPSAMAAAEKASAASEAREAPTVPSLSPPDPGDVARARESAAPAVAVSTPLGTVETPKAVDQDRTQSVQRPPPKPGSGSSVVLIAIAIVILLGAGAGGLWLLKKQGETEQAAKPANPTAPVNGTAPGTAAGTADIEAPPEPPPEPEGLTAEVASATPGATIKMVDGDQSGPAPLTLTGLEDGKTYKLAVSAPGFVSREVELVAGKPLEAVTLEAKPRFIHVTSQPSGSAVYVNSKRKGVTPLDVELKGALAALDELKVEIRRSGFKASAEMLAMNDSWREEDVRMVRDLDVELARRERVVRPPVKPKNGDGDGSGTAASGDGDGDGDGDKTGDGDGDKTGDGDGDKTGDGDGDKTGDGDGDKTGDGDGDKTGDGDGDGDKTGDKGGDTGPTPDWAKKKKKDEGATGPVAP